jgi:NitT/TauT family transport system ATP-binding protein
VDLALSLEGVSKTYKGGVEALRPTDLTVERGAFLSLLGTSGCGKSTLLRLIAGLVPASGGRIVWPGDRPPRLGFGFQEPTLMPWSTVRGNVGLPLRLAGMAKKERLERVDSALDLVGLTGFGDHYPLALSGGMKMRVSIARALVTDPDIMLLDEPFAALDEITRFRLNNDLLDLWRKHGWTVLFVTHSVFESVYLSTRIVVMSPRPGRIHADVAGADPQPRGEAFRTSPDYAARCREISAALDQAMAA